MKYRRVSTGKIVNVSPGYVAAFPAGTYKLVEETKRSAPAAKPKPRKKPEAKPTESEQDK